MSDGCNMMRLYHVSILDTTFRKRCKHAAFGLAFTACLPKRGRPPISVDSAGIPRGIRIENLPARATQFITANFEHIPAKLFAHQMLGVATCKAAGPLIENALREGWPLDAEKITCPVRVLWGTEDRLLPWPSAAVRYRDEWLVQADWVVLDGVGHCPQLDVPLETAELIGGFAAG